MAEGETTLSYSQAVARLEEILKLLDEGKVDIDELSKLVEEAADLVSLCRQKLKAAEIQVQRITERLEREGMEPPAEEEPPF